MKIKVIGCGNAFSRRLFNQSFLLTHENGKNIIVDFGTRIPLALAYHKIDINSIDAVYCSHLHGDHVGGLEELAFIRYDWANKPRHYSETKQPVELIGNEQLLKDLWDKSLRGGLESMEGFPASIETFFKPVPIPANKPYDWYGYTINLVQQIHIMTGNVFSHTFGLLIEKDGHKTVYITTDSQHCSPKQIEIFYKKADIILQDCELIGFDTATRESKFSSGVHANYAQLAGYASANSIKLSNDIRSKMWLSHYQDFKLQNIDFFKNSIDWNSLAIEDGFAGFTELGQEFETLK